MNLITVSIDTYKFTILRKDLLVKDPHANYFLLHLAEYLYKNRHFELKTAIVGYLDQIAYNWLCYFILEPDMEEKRIDSTSMVLCLKTPTNTMEIDLLSMEKFSDESHKTAMLMSWGERVYRFMNEQR